jgi:hypothetical protein
MASSGAVFLRLGGVHQADAEAVALELASFVAVDTDFACEVQGQVFEHELEIRIRDHMRVGVCEDLEGPFRVGHDGSLPVGFLPRVLRSQGPPMRIVLY